VERFDVSQAGRGRACACLCACFVVGAASGRCCICACACGGRVRSEQSAGEAGPDPSAKNRPPLFYPFSAPGWPPSPPPPGWRCLPAVIFPSRTSRSACASPSLAEAPARAARLATTWVGFLADPPLGTNHHSGFRAVSDATVSRTLTFIRVAGGGSCGPCVCRCLRQGVGRSPEAGEGEAGGGASSVRSVHALTVSLTRFQLDTAA
jgi:hypothetical protein